MGFGWTQRIIAFISLFMGIVAVVTIKARIAPRKGTYFLPGAFKNMAYTLQVIGLFFVCWGLFTVSEYLVRLSSPTNHSTS
jgi:hypothetical protein